MNEPRKRKHEHAGYLPDISLFRGARHASRTGGSWYSQRRFYPRDAKLVRLLAMALCLSVCPCLPQVGVLSVLARQPLSICPTLCYKEIQVYLQKGLLPSGTLSETPESENFATAYRSSKRVMNLAREMWTLRSTGPSSVN